METKDLIIIFEKVLKLVKLDCDTYKEHEFKYTKCDKPYGICTHLYFLNENNGENRFAYNTLVNYADEQNVYRGDLAYWFDFNSDRITFLEGFIEYLRKEANNA